MSLVLDSMGPFKSSLPMCPVDQHCSEWARKYMSYCLCDVKDGLSLFLGIVSVISWVVAEIPQIITNYRQKSTEGLSVSFLLTWIIGDLFNVFGCLLEPATLPTQYYMAVLYTMTTIILAGQTVYYGHIYSRLKQRGQEYKNKDITLELPDVHSQQDKRFFSMNIDSIFFSERSKQNLKPNATDSVEIERLRISNGEFKPENVADGWKNGHYASDVGHKQTSPIPLPAVPENASPRRGLYYVSARSLSSSHTPPAGSFFTQRMSPSSFHTLTTIEEPLLSRSSPKSAPAPRTKNMLYLASAVTFIGSLSLLSTKNGMKETFEETSATVMKVSRKILQVNGGLFEGIGSVGGAGIGMFLGWAMAAIYMGGRLPQIFLNMRRGNVEGLNPLMFVFALVGNGTYVASILVRSVKWSSIKPNLPWLVDAAGCVLLDFIILCQFIYFQFERPHEEEKA